MRNVKKRSVWGFLFVGVLGVLFHFAYDFLGQNAVAGVFFPINESIWEHLKLLYFPVILWWMIEYFTGAERKRFFASRVWALCIGLFFIPIAFYTYSGVIGRRFAWADIGIFFVADYLYFRLAKGFGEDPKEESEGENILSAIVFLVWLFAFFVFTFFPPALGIFQNP